MSEFVADAIVQVANGDLPFKLVLDAIPLYPLIIPFLTYVKSHRNRANRRLIVLLLGVKVGMVVILARDALFGNCIL